MKMKRNIIIASLAHLILWIFISIITIIEAVTYQAPPEEEPLGAFMAQGIYFALVIFAIAGVASATVLFLALRAVSTYLKTATEGKRKTILCFSVIGTVLFYSFLVLVFSVGWDIILIIPIAWLVCELGCGILLFPD